MAQWKNWIRHSEGIAPALIVLLAFALFFRLGYMELRGEEARRALVAMEMLAQGSFWVPSLHGLPYLNKPPLYQWVLMVFFSGPFSVTETLIRIPGVLSGILTALLVWWVGRHWLEEKYARLAGWMYLTSADLLYFGLVHAGEIDPFYALITFGQIATLWLAVSGKRPAHYLMISFLLAAAGIMTKGLPSIFHQGISVFLLLVIYRKWRYLLNPWMLGGVAAMVAIPAGYFMAYDSIGDAGAYLTNLYWESVKKSGAVSTPSEILIHLVTFPFQFVWLIFPWGLALLFLLKKDLRKNWSVQPEQRFLLFLLLINLSVYWLSPDTRNRYLYPFLPLMLLLLTPLMKQVSWPRINLVLVALITFRLVYSMLIMPVQSRHFPMRQSVHEALKITRDEPVYYLEKWRSETYRFSTPWLGTLEGELRVTPSVHYKIPCYLMASNGKVVRFDTVPVDQQWYITRDSVWPGDSKDIYFRFPPKGDEEPLILARRSSGH